MTDSLVLPSAVRTAFARIVDYAGLFPPAELSLESAAKEYLDHRKGPQSWMLGRFVAPVKDLSLVRRRFENEPPVPIAAITDIPRDPDNWDTAYSDYLEEASTFLTGPAQLEAMETTKTLIASEDEKKMFFGMMRQFREYLGTYGLDSIPVAVELPWGLDRDTCIETLGLLQELGFAAKIRCGGVIADAVPPVDELAHVIDAAVRAGVALKATAGLHHPVRHLNKDAGFVMHGFLNVLAAAAFAPQCDNATLEAIVSEEDPQAFRFDDRGFWWNEYVADDQRLQEVRVHRFRGFGSCSFGEPVDDLVALGILPASA